MGEREVNLPQLFSDVSRTISGISNIMGTNPEMHGEEGSTASGGGGGIFGNTCFKACGMEDIQFAARAAGDMFTTIRTCVLLSTVASLLLLLLLALTIIFLLCTQSSLSKRFTLPSVFRRVVSTGNTTSQQPK
ncbi:unnamed protein product [Caenorhabditis auriculariae]|uniref:Uncharacterized protein n=1 Tax=Caenorhabditis auriculariae TaxID=2777116 RepID=A0A8S1H0H1_9PELO|nr:unnamed protein product [Caenorhabditis auriculariae]